VNPGTAVIKTISIAVVDLAIQAGRAELLGNQIGDPVYLTGAFWQIAEDGCSYELVVDPAQAAVCADVLLRLRAARASRTGAR
jgi:hypothetical protein